MQLFDIKFWDKSKVVFLKKLEEDVLLKKRLWIATVNPEFVVESWRDKRFLDILQSKTNYNVVDGNGLLWAAGLSKGSLITGVELIDDLCRLAEKNSIPVYFIGGWGEAALKTGKYFKSKYKNLKYKYFSDQNKYKKLDRKAFTFVALGMKKQEFWIEENLKNLPEGIVVGVGRSFDYYSGAVKRAPVWIRSIKMEWLYSALADKDRAARQLRNLPWFVWRVVFK